MRRDARKNGVLLAPDKDKREFSFLAAATLVSSLHFSCETFCSFSIRNSRKCKLPSRLALLMQFVKCRYANANRRPPRLLGGCRAGPAGGEMTRRKCVNASVSHSVTGSQAQLDSAQFKDVEVAQFERRISS